MDTTLTLPSPAKLNLFLHINGRLENGYHELQTCFQLLDHGDSLTFTLNSSGAISIHPAIDGVATEDNLIYKAAIALKTAGERKTGSPITAGVDILLEKTLPMGGGIGGGSSNAATTLLALNKLWQLNLSLNELSDIGLALGADVPVFVQGHSAWADGVGEKLQPIDLPEKWFLVLHPNCHVSTAQIFSNERLTRDSPKIKIAPALEGQAYDGFNNDSFRNDCEAVVKSLYPEIRDALSWLSQFGDARLTGTGACCFIALNSQGEAEQVLNEARSKFKGFIAKGVNLSPAHQRLNEAD